MSVSSLMSISPQTIFTFLDNLFRYPLVTVLIGIVTTLYGANQVHQLASKRDLTNQELNSQRNFTNQRLASQRDLSNKRREIRTKYLIEAFRRAESAAMQSEDLEEIEKTIESALADIQLFGTNEQIKLAHVFMVGMQKNGTASIQPILESLRKDLREELELEEAEKEVIVFRFKGESKDA